MTDQTISYEIYRGCNYWCVNGLWYWKPLNGEIPRGGYATENRVLSAIDVYKKEQSNDKR